MKLCDRCKGEGRIKLPEYDLNNPQPATWEEPDSCCVCGGIGWLKVLK